ncbi:MAG: phospholipase D family protein [Acidobacteriaceae bacterium]|nr:phospholipase D family protein [Acidobacteriaceae bacterium]
MKFSLATALALSIVVAVTVPAEAARKKPKRTVADEITTAAIDIATSAIEKRISRVPADGQIEIAFAPIPQRSAERLVIKVIDAAQTSAFMAAYQMTSKPIADAMCRAAERGVAVSAVLDAKSNKHGDGNSKYDYMLACGVDVRTDARYPIMHDKFIVVDGKHVETGSFNYTFSAAERNAENALVVWNNVNLANRYSTEFDRLFNEASD